MPKNKYACIGRTNRAKNGQIMTIIDYRNCHNLDVQFDDGTIVLNKSLYNFNLGRISNPNYKLSHIGETINSKYGMTATIIAYRRYNDIDVQFEDGYIAKNTSYALFIKDSVLNKNVAANPAQAKNIDTRKDRLGQQLKANNGQLMTIIKYRSAGDMDIQFEDGTIVQHKSYTNFLTGNIRNPNTFNRNKENNSRWNDRTGEVRTASNGQKMTIIRYNGITDIDVKFEDGTVVKNKMYSNFLTGHIENPNKANRVKASDIIGLTNRANNEMMMTIIEATNTKNIIVEFEDGTHVKTSFTAFKNGTVSSNSEKEKELKISKLQNLHTGEKWKDSNGEEAEIIGRETKDGKPTTKYIVRWENGQELSTIYFNITHGKFSKRNATKVGLTSVTKSGDKIKIVGYRNSHDIDVEFEDGTLLEHRCLSDFYLGSIRKIPLMHYQRLGELCSKFNVNFNKALAFKKTHNYMSDEQIIVHYRPDCYINIFGELVIPK